MDPMATTESIIDDVIGCGPFQVKLFFLGVVLIKSSSFIVTATTVFVTYNPGWRCVNNVTTLLGHPNRTDLTTVTPGHNDTLDEYTMGSCGEYKICREVEFNPESSTIVTEWRLLCDKAWSQPGIAVMTTVLVAVAKGFSEGAIAFTYARTGELYPTVVRGLAVGCGSSVGLIGGMVAPWVIPHGQEQLVAYVFSVGAVSLVCCVVSVLMPETRGKALKETF